MCIFWVFLLEFCGLMISRCVVGWWLLMVLGIGVDVVIGGVFCSDVVVVVY